MLYRIAFIVMTAVAASASVEAGDHFYFPGYPYAPPVVYAAPVVAYQPAYVVPTPVVTVQTFPVTAVSYSTHYFAPVVPTVAPYYVARPVYSPVVYGAPIHMGRRHFRPYRGVEIEFERDGDIEIDYR